MVAVVTKFTAFKLSLGQVRFVYTPVLLVRRPPAGITDSAIARMCFGRLIADYYGPPSATQRTVGGGLSRKSLDRYGAHVLLAFGPPA